MDTMHSAALDTASAGGQTRRREERRHRDSGIDENREVPNQTRDCVTLLFAYACLSQLGKGDSRVF